MRSSWTRRWFSRFRNFRGYEALFGLVLVTFLSPKAIFAGPLDPLAGPRSMGMGGAHRGLGTSNDSLVLNPAGMAAIPRYSVDVAYALRADHISRVFISAVDSRTGPIAAGVGYTREWGNPSHFDLKINRFVSAIAFSPLTFLKAGLALTNTKGGVTVDDQRWEPNNFNGNAGILLSLAQMVSVGVTYDNVIHREAHGLLAPALGFGASIRTRLFSIAGDMRIDRRDAMVNSRTYNAGAEVFLGQMFAVRGGWRLDYIDSTPGSHLAQVVSAGAGAYAAGGGIEAAFEKMLESSGWTFCGALQFAM